MPLSNLHFTIVPTLLLVTVGEDFISLSGEDVITIESDKATEFASVQILIHDDLVDETTECFSAELQSPSCNSSSTVCIGDNSIVFCSFQQQEYFVHESTGNATLALNSSRPISSEFNVDIDIIYGIGNASGEGSHKYYPLSKAMCVISIIMTTCTYV